MGRMVLIASVFAFVAILLSSFIVGVHTSAVRQRRQSGQSNQENKENEVAAPNPSADNATTAPVNSTVAATPTDDSGSPSVAVTVVIVILVVALVIGVAVFVFLRMRRRRMADYEKKTQIQMSSTSNAGVYVDLTSGPAAGKEKQPDSPETEHLNKEDD